MLQNLEKEIDDVDAKIGDRWRLLDRYALASTLFFGKGVGVMLMCRLSGLAEMVPMIK